MSQYSRTKLPRSLRFVAGAALLIAASAAPLLGQKTKFSDETPRLAVLLKGAAASDTAGLRRAVDFLSFVTDSISADVVVTVALNPGQRYVLTFTGAKLLPNRVDTLATATVSDTTAPTRIRVLSGTLKLGLLPYVAKLPVAAGVRVLFAQNGAPEANTTEGNDPWNRWIMSLGVRGSMYSQQRTATHDLGYSAGANRTTEGMRLELGYKMNRSGSRYDIGDESLRSTTRSDTVEVTTVRRLSSRWGLGMVAGTSSSTLLNQKRVYRAAPAVEFSLFPYDDYARKQFIAQYAAGVDHFEYIEETIYDKMQETQPKHALTIAYKANRSWGMLNTSLVGTQYLRDMSKRRLVTAAGVNIGLFSGLQLVTQASYALIRDQLFLPKGDGSVEDVLLKRRQLETGYQYMTTFGLTYSFGSRVRATPNPRLTGGGR